jgi:hypothetical protein
MTNDEGSPNAQMTKGESAFFRDFFVTPSSFGVSFSSVIGALSFLRHSSFELRHFLERFLDFARNDKKVTRARSARHCLALGSTESRPTNLRCDGFLGDAL